MKSLLLLILCLFITEIGFVAGQIDIAYSPYTISQPGSYIVVKDLHTPQDKDCITISTSNITLDLNGHTLYGAGTAIGSSGRGIYGYQLQNITIKNGTIRDFYNNGIYLQEGRNHQINSIKAYGNGYMGINISSDGATITDCISSHNKNNGIKSGYACIVTGCSVLNNGNNGIEVFTGNITNCYAYLNSTGIYGSSGCLIQNNTVRSNIYSGISIYVRNQVIGNNILDQDNATYGYGIYVSGNGNKMDSNHITYNRIGIQFDGTPNWYGRNTFFGNTSTVNGSAPSDPGSPYNNVIF